MEEGWFSIKKPAKEKGAGKRASFAIELCRKVDGKVKTKRLQLPELEQVNKRYSKGTISFEDALKKCELLREKLYLERDKTKPKKYFTEANRKVLDEYWDAKYRLKLNKLKDPDSMWYDLNRAVGACGELSLLIASQDELQAKIDNDLWTNPNKQRRVVTRLNQILKWLNRDFQLDKAPEEYKDIRYLTLDEFNQFIAKVKDPLFKNLCQVAFGTGLRVGEIFGLRTGARQGNLLRVAQQMDSSLNLRGTKTRKQRRARILPGFVDAVDEWLKVPLKARQDFRNYNHSRTVTRICGELWPGDTSKHCVFHDFRHSYAIYLSGKGVPIKQIAEVLGNSQSVCEKYYAGFQLTDYGIELIDKLLDG